MTDVNDTTLTLKLEPPRRCHILVVEDDDLMRAQLTLFLEQAGYDVHSASTGEEALYILGTTPCQIVLTDWNMPEIDGLALCRNLRLRDDQGYVYILMLTVRSTRGDILTALAARPVPSVTRRTRLSPAPR